MVELDERAAEIVDRWRSFHWRLLSELAAYLDHEEQLWMNTAVVDGREDDAVAIIDRAVARRAAGEELRQCLPVPKGPTV